MALISSTRVVNENPGSVTVVVRETTGTGTNDATVTMTVEIDPNHAQWDPGQHTAGFVPPAPNTFIQWVDVLVPTGQRRERTAGIKKNPASDAGSTTVMCVVSGIYQGNPYFETMPVNIVWP
jgi:hypothetical protein